MASNASDVAGGDDEDNSLIIMDDAEAEEDVPDELIIDAEKRPLLEQHLEKIDKQYSVQVTFGLSASDQVKQKQWVTVRGDAVDRRSAKDYIKALCSPAEILPVTFPPELHQMLTQPNVHSKLERQSRTVILFPSVGEAEIQGPDNLSVTLAISSLEDLIAKFENDGPEMSPGKSSPQAGHASSRLESELRRLTSEDKDLVYDDDYTAMPNAVKRTILGWYIEESPKVVKGGLRPAAPEELPSSAVRGMQQLQPSSASATGSVATPAHPREQELRDLGSSMGYTSEEVERVFQAQGKDLKDSDFMQSLVSQRSPLQKGAAAATFSTPDRKAHPVEQIINTHSPGLLQRQGQDAGEPSTSQVNGAPPQDKHFVNYLQQLSKDFVEESEDQDIDTFKKRNAERLRLLKVVIDQQKEGRKVDEIEVIQINDDSDEEPESAAPKISTKSKSKSDENNSAAANKRGGGKKNRRSPQQHKGGARAKSPQVRMASPQRNNRGGSPQRNNRKGASNRRGSPLRNQQQSPVRRQQRTSVCENGPPHRQNTMRFPPHISPVRPSQTQTGSNKRYIVIDGSNVAMHHSNHRFFSCRGLEICINYFLKLGHTEITAFVPQWRCRSDNPGFPIQDRHLLETLKQKGFVVYTPARRVPGKNIVCYDDKFVIRLAEETDGIIVSNDNFRDIWNEKRDWRKIIETRLVGFSFVGDIFMLPEDPLGRNGPHIDEFLRKMDPEAEERLYQQRNSQQGDARGGAPNRFPAAQPAQSGWYRGGPQYNQGTNWQPGGYLGGWQGQGPMQGANRPVGQQAPPRYWQPQPQPHFPRNNAPNAWSTPLQNAPGNNTYQPANNRQHHFSQPQPQQQQHQQPQQPAQRQQHNSAPAGRDNTTTEWLQKNLMGVFPDNLDMVNRILQNHPKETNLNELSSFILEALVDH